MSLGHHNKVLQAGEKRALELEGRFVRVLTPTLEQAGRDAARAFTANATNHLTAAAHRHADRQAAARIPRGERRPLVLTAAMDVQATSTMICVKPRPDEAAALADPDGLPAENLHCTLAYLGELDGDLRPILDALGGVAGSHAALAGVVGGYGQFGMPDGSRVGILLPDVPGLVELRVAVTEALTEAGIDYARNHGFEAHLTVDPDPEAGELDEMLPLSGSPLHFDELLLVRGDTEIHPLPLVGVPPITAAGGNPDWSAPAPDELIDVERLVASLRTKTDPVRQAVVRTLFEGAAKGLGSPVKIEIEHPLFRYYNASEKARSNPDTIALLQKEIDRLYAETETWSPAARAVALEGLQETEDAEIATVRSAEGELRAIAAYHHGASANNLGFRGMHVADLAAAGGGGEGTLLLRALAQKAHDAGDSLYLDAAVDAVPYYQNLGIPQVGDTTEFRMTAREAGQFAREPFVSIDGVGISFNVSNPLVSRVLAQTGSQIVDIAKTTQTNVMRIISASYEQGLTIPDTAKAIRVGMSEAAGARATLIARTELAGAVNGGSLAATQIVQNETGTNYSKKWLTASGAKYPRHEDYEGLDGQTVALNETFDVGGAQMQHPGDPDGPADEICNCRCTMSYTDEAE